MTVSSEVSRVEYAGNGSTTVFPIPFYFIANADLQLVLTAADGSTSTPSATISGAGNPAGGSATLSVAPASGSALEIYRDPPLTQTTSYGAGRFPAASHERALDRAVMIMQRLKARVDEQEERLDDVFDDIDEAVAGAVEEIEDQEAASVIVVQNQQSTSVAAVSAAADAETEAAIEAIEEQEAISVAAVAGAMGGVLNGAGTPSDSLGADGQYYIDVTNNYLFGPKAGGEWPLDPWDLGAPLDVEPPLPSGAAIVVFAQDYDSTNRVMPNRVRSGSASDPLKVLTRCPRQCFTTSSVGESMWSSVGFTTTANYANDLDGTATAMRLVSTGAGTGVILYAVNISCVAGDYAIIAHLQSNSGSQSWEYSIDGSSWTGFTVTTTMTRHAFTLTLGSTTNVRIRIRPASGVTGDANLGKFYLWKGNVASAPADLIFGGDGFIGTGPGATVDCTTERLSLSTAQCVHYDLQTPLSGTEITVIAVTTRTDSAYNNGFRDTFLTDILGSVSDGSISLRENETASLHKMGMLWSVVTEPKDTYSPNYGTLGGYHAHVGFVEATAREVWHDDVSLGFVQGLTLSSKTVYHWQTGTNNSFPRDHDLVALIMAPVKWSPAEIRAALRYIDYYIEAEGGVIARPVNNLLAEGDSITVGSSNNSYVQQSLGLFAEPVIVHNAAIGGSVIAGNPVPTLDLTTRMTRHLANIPNAATRTGRAFVFTFLFGANDIPGYTATAAAWLAAMEAQAAAAMAAGYTVGIATILPKGTAISGYATHNTQRALINTELTTNWVNDEKCHFIIDFAGDATMGPDAAANNLTYYGDGLHPTAAGHTILAGIYQTAVDAWLL